MNESFPTHAEIIIVGGAITGSSLACHLTRLGRKVVVLLAARPAPISDRSPTTPGAAAAATRAGRHG